MGDADGVQVGGKSFSDFVVTDPANTLGGGSAVYLVTGGLGFSRRANRTLNPTTDAVKFTGTGTVGDKTAALGNVTGGTFADFIFSTGGGPKLVFRDGGGAWQELVFSSYTPSAAGLLAGVGDVDRDGWNDILIGNAAGDAYLFHGAASLTPGVLPVVTLTGVAAAASAPYAAGADLNCDASSDLLLIPGAALVAAKSDSGAVSTLPRTELDFAQANVPSNRLPVGTEDGGSVSERRTEVGGRTEDGVDKMEGVQNHNPPTLYVDDDYCSACANDGHTWASDAYATIQAAVDAADAGDTIVVNPGVYVGFSVSGATKNSVKVKGVNPDAVFVNGAVTIQNATGVQLSKLTIRSSAVGTATLLTLTNAGVGGVANSSLKTQLDNSVLYGYTSHAISMDRVSTLTTTRTTIAGEPGSGSYIDIGGATDPAFVRDWSAADAVTDFPSLVGDGGAFTSVGNTLYGLRGKNSRGVLYYNSAPPSGLWSGGSGETLPAVPGKPNALAPADGSGVYVLNSTPNLGAVTNGTINATITDGSGNVYIGGSFSTVAGVSASNIAKWTAASQSWGTVHGGLNGAVAAMAFDNSGKLWVGGSFTANAANTKTLNYVTYSDGTDWVVAGPAPGGLNYDVFDLKVDPNGTVVVSGRFSNVGGGSAPYDPVGYPIFDGGATTVCDPGVDEIGLYNFSEKRCAIFQIGQYPDLTALGTTFNDGPRFPDNKATEVRVGGLVQVELCQNPNYGGTCTTFSSDSANLGGLSGAVSSLKVKRLTSIPYQVSRWNGTSWEGFGNAINGPTWTVESDGAYMYSAGYALPYDPPGVDAYPSGTNCNPNENQVALFVDQSYNWGDDDGGAGDKYCKVFDINNEGEWTVLDSNLAGKVSSVQVGGRVALGMYRRADAVNENNNSFVYLTHDVADLSRFQFENGGANVNDNVLAIQVGLQCSLCISDGIQRLYLPAQREFVTWNTMGSLEYVQTNAAAFVSALKLSNGILYVGGQFANIADVYTGGSNFARFDTNANWMQTTGVDCCVRSINASPSGKIVVGGTFTSPGTRVAQFDPTNATWSSYGSGLTSGVNAIGFHPTDGVVLLAEGAKVSRYFPTRQAINPPSLFYRYQGGSFSNKAPLPVAPGLGLSLAGDGAGNAWALVGGGTSTYRYLSGTSAWTAGGVLTTTVGAGGALAYAGTNGLYALVGGGSPRFFRSTNSGVTWTALADAPFAPGDGAGLAWDGAEYLYATQAGNGLGFMRYSLVDSVWETLGDNSSGTTGDDSVPVQVGPGGGLARISNTLYALRGNDTTDLYSYSPIGLPRPEKLTLDRVAFAQPSTVSSSQWISPTQQTEDFGVGRTGLAWVGDGTWSPLQTVRPGSFASTVSLAAAKFVDQVRHVFRLQSASTLTAGYADALGDAFVAPGYCATCANDGLTWGQTAFSSIQAAIDRGAPRVNLRPGLYREPFYLTNGVQVNGSGPDLTIVQPPAGSSPSYLVSAEGIVGASLNRLTLAGAGLRVEDGALSVRAFRNIIRGAMTAIRQDGAATELEVVNNTLVNNTDGLSATGCAAVDVRNTIFASHSGVALKYQGAGSTCNPTPTQLDRYNLFWLNAGDVKIDNGTPQAAFGPGDITLDPYFTAPNQLNFRPRVGSPAADAGNPTDPSPPGSNGRVDIGAFEVGQAAFYADDNYCDPAVNSACVNDGLTWGVDAFSRIQDAVNAAQIASTAVNTPSSFTTFTVGVGAGTYNEHVVVPSYIHLVGSGAEQTTINGGGTGDVVTLNGAVQAEVRGFTLTGSGTGATNAGIRVAGASNTVSLSRNILRGNRVGILFAGGATGEAQFNTIVNNTAAGVRSEVANTWVTVSNNILSGNNPGLEVTSPAQIFHAYNLLYNTPNANFSAGLAADATELVGQNPNLTAGDYRLNANSPAVDAAEPGVEPPVGGGTRADMGYRERLAVPLTLLFGREGVSCTIGNSGMGTVDVALVGLPTTSWSSGVTTTLPSTAAWSAATFQGGTTGDTARYWTANVTPASEGLYRLYTRATDRLGNQEPPAPQLSSDLYAGSFYADGTPPLVAWITPSTTPTSTTGVAIELVASASDYVNSGLASRFSVASMWFEVDGVVWPADWVGTVVPSSGPRTFRAVVPITVGAHSVKAVAVDRAGNRGEQTISVTGAASGEVATITSIKTGSATNQSVLTVAGYALFTSAGANHRVNVTVDALPAVQATLANATAQFTAWTIVVNLPNPNVDADHTISAVASSVALGKLEATSDLGSSVTFRLDRTAPTATITPPTTNPISTTVTLQGTAADTGGSGLDRVEVSVDGGATWAVASLVLTSGNPNSATWSLTWTPPADQNSVTFPVQARAVDKATNQTTPVATLNLKVDNVAPPALAPTFNPIEGTHFGGPSSVQVTWTPALDGSGPPDTLVTVDKLANTEPGTVVTSPYAASFTSGGQWYIHLATRDAAGNRSTTTHYGPWYVDSSDTGLCLDSRTVQVDGVLDLATQEWRDNRELLDDDERPTTRQKLYATWDASYLYLGWHGASWELDGAMWATPRRVAQGRQPLSHP
ncbi:MAG: hypothetical protein KIT87_21380 [Anaerolineae bacterium]|nr:hypothetical protein [Anaerolineae bacterium]